MQVSLRLPQLSAGLPQPGVGARGPGQRGQRVPGGIPQPRQQVRDTGAQDDDDDDDDDVIIAGATGTGAERAGRGGAGRGVRARASGRRTGTAGQTGDHCCVTMVTSRMCDGIFRHTVN